MGDIGNIVSRDNYDVIVVGTGPGGATVAREMAKKKKKVLMLEWGPAKGPRGTQFQAFEEMLMPMKGCYLTPQYCGVARAITVGGSSLYFYGTSVPVPMGMFKSRGLDLTEDQAEVYKDLSFIGPLADHMISPPAKAMMESAQDLGFGWKPNDKFINKDKWTPDYVFGPSDPREVKWTAHMWVRDALVDGATLIDRAKVTRVILENKKAVGVEFKTKGQKEL